ncbi:MAG: RHS repeat-associated core domain-containing protein [Nitrososphaera sp.]|nr:RHS repeat-associated core domain-containing protein [Nitrososphaera sp.]
MDYFLARYYSSAQGRFTSPDEPLIDQSVNHPQSWNLYTYVRNNPLRYIDPNGKRTEWYDKDGRFLGADDEVTIDREKGTLTAKDGRVYNLEELQVIEQIKAGPEDDTEELKELQSDSGAGALVLAAGGVALLDTPAPGPADVVSLGILAVAAIVALNQPSDSILLSQNKHNKEVLAGLLEAAGRELGKLRSDPPGPGGPQDHHKREIKAILERAKRIAKRLVGKSRAEAEKVIEAIEKEAASH